jgi:hypothetical protein
VTDTAVPVQAVVVSPATASVEAANAEPPKKKTNVGAFVRSAGLRAARTFTQAFLAVLTASPALHLNISVLDTAATAGFAAVLTLAQRILDETNIPTIPAG